jgi:crotonobetainyl-CoA:carnitine CoA-transferase CaiB-like acyl-CoA transferase
LLFGFLCRGKRSVVGEPTDDAVVDLLARADVVLESGQLSLDDIAALQRRRPDLVVVSVTPFGRTGPWADRPGTDFTLQGWSTSLAFRGLPDREPLQIAGQVPEWLAGTYAACCAVGAHLGAARNGRGDHVDVSVLETALGRFGGGALFDLHSTASATPAHRTLELPSIERTADGFVGVCPNTAQMMSDLLVMIERPDLVEDRDLASFAGRWRRRDELRGYIEAWSTTKTTATILEQASLFRVPAAPVAAPDTVATMEHYVARGIFVEGPVDGSLAPRVPFQIDGEARRPQGRVAVLGGSTGAIEWDEREAPASGAPALPLEGLRVIDLTTFWAGPVATQLLGTLGADVIHVESVQRPDGYRFIRMAEGPLPDDWWERSTGFHAVNTNKRGITLDLSREEGRELLLQLVDHADVFVENYAPRVLHNLGLSVEELRERNPSMIVTRMPGYGLSGPWREWSAFASTIEAASGLAWRCGYRDGPPITLRGPADPIAGIHAAFAILAALRERGRTGKGCAIEASMIEAALNVAAEVVLEHSAHGAVLPRLGNRGPGAPQGIYACRGDEQWLAVAVVDDEQWAGLRKALGDPAWARDPEFDADAGRRRRHDELDAHLAAWAAGQDRDQAVELLVELGVPVAPVVAGRDLLANEQLRARGAYEALPSDVLVDHVMATIPFSFRSRRTPWTVRTAPRLGEHNREVLGDLLGLTDEQIDELERDEIIGNRPKGT